MTTPKTFDVQAFVDEHRLRPVHFAVMALCFLVMFVDGFDIFMVGKIAPAIAEDFGVTTAHMTIVILLQQVGTRSGRLSGQPIGRLFRSQENAGNLFCDIRPHHDRHSVRAVDPGYGDLAWVGRPLSGRCSAHGGRPDFRVHTPPSTCDIYRNRNDWLQPWECCGCAYRIAGTGFRLAEWFLGRWADAARAFAFDGFLPAGILKLPGEPESA